MDIVEQLSAQYGSGGKSRPSPGGDLVDQLSVQYGLTAPAPRTRNPAAFVNDTVIEGLNAVAGGIKSASDFISPNNPVSRGVQSFIDYGAERQSDVVKQSKRELSDALETDDVGTQLSGVGRYVIQNPVLATAQALGSFAGPGAAIKGVQLGGRALGLGQRATTQLGLGAGSVVGGAMSGGDAAGNAFDLVYNSSQLANMPEEQRQELATQAAREASVAPALYGLITGRFGAEGALARGTSRGILRTAGSEALQEFGDEALSAYSGRKAASQYDPTINPMQGVIGQGALGAVLGGISGGAVGALTRGQPASLLPDSNPSPTPTFETPPAQPQQPLGLPYYANEPMVVFPDGTTMTAAEARQQRADGFTYSGRSPVEDGPTPSPVPLQQVETSPGALTVPSQPEAEWLQQQYDQRAQQEQVEREYAALGEAAATAPFYQQAQAEEARLSPQRGLFDYYQEAQPSAPVTEDPVLNNAQNPNQQELFFPNGAPTYAATQNAPDVAGAVTETSRAAGIPAGRPGSKAGTKRQQLLERIEKARTEGRFVGREEQYDDLVNDLGQNAFGRVEKGIAEVEKAPLQATPQADASAFAAPGTRTLQEVDVEMDAMLVKGRPPKEGVAFEAWSDLQRERDALAAQVGAPPRPKYVPPKKVAAATPNNAAKPTAAPTPVPAPAPPSPPARPVAEKAPKAPTQLNETAQEAFDAMQDEVTYKDLTPEAKGLVDGAHKEGRLSQEEIDFIVKQDKTAKIAAKRAASKVKTEEELGIEDVPKEVVSKTRVQVKVPGKEGKQTMSAKDAVQELKKQKDILQNLKNCLKK